MPDGDYARIPQGRLLGRAPPCRLSSAARHLPNHGQGEKKTNNKQNGGEGEARPCPWPLLTRGSIWQGKRGRKIMAPPRVMLLKRLCCEMPIAEGSFRWLEQVRIQQGGLGRARLAAGTSQKGGEGATRVTAGPMGPRSRGRTLSLRPNARRGCRGTTAGPCPH